MDDTRWFPTHEITYLDRNHLEQSRLVMLVQSKEIREYQDLFTFEEWYRRHYPTRWTIEYKKLIDRDKNTRYPSLRVLDTWEISNYWCSRNYVEECNLMAYYDNILVVFWCGAQDDFSEELEYLMDSLPKGKYLGKLKIMPAQRPH